MTTARLCTTPNQHAGAAALQLTPSSATFGGYQAFVLTRHGVQVLPGDRSLVRKHELLAPVFQPALLTGRTILDLGANSAFFSFLGLQNGAVGATAVDIDAAHLHNAARAAAALGFDRLVTTEANVSDWQEPADVVVALALVHWLHNCTATFGSLGAVVEHLARLAKYALIVEWVDPDDPHIEFFGHLAWNPAGQPGPYDRALFEHELSTRFARVLPLGDVSPTRRLFLAFKHRHDIDLGCPMPLLHPADRVISCNRLTVHDGVEYWSRVYDLGDRIHKQTIGDLAAREALVLQRLQSDAVPRVLDVSDSIETSTLTIEKIDGQSFDDAIPAIVASEDAFRAFLAAGLNVLQSLREAQVVHRDVRRENLMVRDGRPVLLDFGWATAPDLPIFTPEGFSPRMDSSDVQAFGALLLQLCPTTWPIRRVVSLMANGDPALRIDDPRLLQELIEAGDASTATSLLSQIARRDRVIAELRERLLAAEAQAQSDRRNIVYTEAALASAERALAGSTSNDAIGAFAASLGPSPTVDVDVALDLAPALRPCALAYAALLRQTAQPLVALEFTTRVLTTLSESADRDVWLVALYAKASLCRELGRLDDALDAFDRILACDPEQVSVKIRGGAFYHSALVLEAQGAVDVALSRLDQCVALMPDHAAARTALERLRQGSSPG